jgi:hypothetical protein
MIRSEFFLGPEWDLTKEEIEPLLHVKAGARVSEWAYTRLEMADLVVRGIAGWKLTQAGAHLLASAE